jgi:EmrB/QacA subfamily drug resistance transporter
VTSTPGAPVVIPRKAWLTLAITSASIFMVSLEITVISLAFPEILAAFPDTPPTTLSWVFTAYNIGVASLLLVSGWLADRNGRKRIFLAGLAVFAVGSLGSGLAWSAEALIGMRVVQAVGGAALYPASLALLLGAFPPQRRQLAVGVWGAMGGIAAAFGPTAGALLVAGFGWRAVFMVNLPVAALALVAGWRILEESKGAARGKVDLISVPLASLGVGLLVFAITRSDSWGLTSSKTLATVAVAALLLVVFVVRSLRHPEPLFDLGLFRIRSFAVANGGSMLFATAFFGWLTLLPSFVQIEWGWSVLRTGFAIAPGPLVSGMFSSWFGSLADRLGNRPVLVFGALSGATGMLLHVVFTGTDPSYVTGLLLPSIFIGLAGAASFAGLVGAAVRDVPPTKFAMAGAGRTTIFQLAVALGIATAAAVIGEPGSSAERLSGYQVSWTISLVLYLGMAVLFFVAYPAGRPVTLVRPPQPAAADPG